MDQQRVDGLLVAVTVTPYGSFTDRQTGEIRPGGETFRLFVSTSFELAPVEIKVPVLERTTFEHLRAAGQGARVAVVCDLNAKGGGQGGKAFIERRFVCLVPVEAGGNGAAAAVPVGADAEPF